MTKTPSKLTPSKLALGSAALLALSLVAHDKVEASPKVGPRLNQKPLVQSYSMVTQSRGRLGAKVITMSEDLRAFFGAPKDQGLLIDSVVADTPAAKAGLRSGDVIIAVEGEAISETWDIMQAMGKAKKGDSVRIEIVRDHKKRSLSATLDTDAGGQMQWGRMPDGFNFGFDFGQGGNGPDVFGKGFPFNHAPMMPGDMFEKMKRMEERLNKLEGKSPLQPIPKKKNSSKGSKESKKRPFRTGGTRGNAS